MNSRLGMGAVAGVLCLNFLLWGCGGGGDDGSPAPLIISGTVQAPNGQIVFNPQQNLFKRFANFIVTSVNASVSGISSVADGTPVGLTRINDTGNVVTTLATTTTSGGIYSFNLTELGLGFSSDLMVQVVNHSSGAQMRAFVTREIVDINPVSETGVRIILDQIAQTQDASLSHFTTQELTDLVASIDLLTGVKQTAVGIDLEATVTTIKNTVSADTGLMAFITSASGTGQTTEGPGDIGNFFPFTQGLSWRFKGVYSVNGGPDINFDNTSKIIGTKTIKGMTVPVFTESDFNNALGELREYYLFKDSHGITYQGNNDPTDLVSPILVPYPVLKFPLQLGASFQQLNKTGLDVGGDFDRDGRNEKADIISRVTIIGMEDVVVPFGSFQNSIKIETTTTVTFTLSSNGIKIATIRTLTQWFAPEIGPVKRVSQIKTDGPVERFDEIVTEELSSMAVAVGTGPASVAMGDLNKDGKLDLAVTNSGSNTVSILLGTGTGLFGVPTNFAVGVYPTSIAMGDLNGDEQLDLAIVNGGSDDVSILLGDGTGSFQAPMSFAVGRDPVSVVIGDLNKDGKPDLVVGNFGANTIFILLGDGIGSFNLTTSIPSPGTFDIRIVDMNGDGNLDLVVPIGCCHYVSIWLGDGSGSFGGPTKVDNTGEFPSSLAIGDLNGDGNLDLVVGHFASDTVAVQLGDQYGFFGEPWSLAVGDGPASITVGDLNSDGNLDIAVANNYGGSVSILLGYGTGSFSRARDFSTGNYPNNIALGDLNGDGRLDLIVPNAGDNNVAILLNPF